MYTFSDIFTNSHIPYKCFTQTLHESLILTSISRANFYIMKFLSKEYNLTVILGF